MTMHAFCRRRGIIGAAALLLLLGAAPAVRASVWGYRVYCTEPTMKMAIPVEHETYPTREECAAYALTTCRRGLPFWCAYALHEHDQGNNWFKQTDLDWCGAAVRVKADRLEAFCRAVIIP
jgi:hypothetical protein